MKNRLYLISLMLLIPLMSGCNKTKYSVSKMTVEHPNSYQLWANFDYSNLKVTYDGTELETKQYNVDFANFDTSKIGTSEITVSLSKSPSTAITIPIEVTNRKSCNYLAIGDLYVEDTINYANEIIKKSDDTLDIKIYGACINDATLDEHYNYFVHNDCLYSFNEYNFETKSWEKTDELSLKDILVNSEVKWDVISLQEHATSAGQVSSFNNLSKFIKSMSSYLSAQGRNVPTFCYDMAWAYQGGVSIDSAYYEYYNNDQIAMFEAIAKQTKEIVEPTDLFNFIVPTGTFIQDARTTSIVTEKEFTRDGKYLDLKYGRYVAALGLASKLTGYSAEHFTYCGEEGEELVTESEQKLLFAVVKAAIEAPYIVTGVAI